MGSYYRIVCVSQCEHTQHRMRPSTVLAFSLATLVLAQDGSLDPLEALANNIPGVPGQDYPIYSSPPDTALTCDGKIEGYYADPDTECQVFHICANDSSQGKLKYSFLCPNGTLFNQQYFICDWWFNVDCAQAESLYYINDEIAAAAVAAEEAQAAARDGGVEPKINARLGREGFSDTNRVSAKNQGVSSQSLVPRSSQSVVPGSLFRVGQVRGQTKGGPTLGGRRGGRILGRVGV